MIRWAQVREKALGRGREIARSESGVAAVEFAMITPVLLLLYFGSVDLSQGIDADRKLAYVTHTVGDLAAQVSGNVTTADLEGLLAIADTVLHPFDPARVSIRITIADIAADGSYTLYEPVSRQGGSGGCTGEITLPQTIIDLARGRSIVATDGCYAYTPVVGYAISTDIPLYKRSFNVSRSESFNYQGDVASPGQEEEEAGSGNGGNGGNGGSGGSGGNNCAGNSGGHGQGNNCNNPNQSNGGNGNGNGNGNGRRG